MAGKQSNTRKKHSHKLHPQLVFTTHSHKYKKYLLAYALEKKQRQALSEKTVTVTGTNGVIFSRNDRLFSHVAAQLKAITAVPRSNKKRGKKNRFIWWWFVLITALKWQTAVKKAVRTTLKPVYRATRSFTRWNRKKSWGFRRSINKKKKSSSHTTTNPLTSIWRPFYYTLRLFPVHTSIALLLSFFILGTTWAASEYIFKDLPDPHDLTRLTPPVTTKILDRNGNVLFRLYEDENRTIVPLSKISPYVINATIAIEDKDFYSHNGFSIRGISRAFLSNSQGEQTQGGSTITQQLVKLRLLSPEQTLQRKIKEVIVAILAEGIYEKNQILEMYLNQVPYGGATYGIEEASQKYFNKSAKDLNLAESALIAGLPAAPSAYTPFGSNPEFAKNRQLEVLRRMVEDGVVSQEEADTAANQTLAFATNTIDIQAPHFVMYVRDLLESEYGLEALYQGGLEVRTSLDLTLQNQVQQQVSDEVNRLKNLNISNGSALVTNPKTGEVYAMVGSTNYFDFEHDGQVNVTTRPRQPGSSIKPLTYALALEKGMTVTTRIEDSPVTYEVAGAKPYTPQNYDGRYHGRVTLKEALASSYNIPAVKLLNEIGVNTFIDKAEAMGITTWKDRRRFGLSLTLGGGEVLMTDMAKLYGAFANEGYVTTLNPILEIRTHKGETLYKNTCAIEGLGCFREKVLDSRVAYLVSNMLSDNAARTPAFGPQSTLHIPNQEVAVKTGTTNNMRDNWTFGYTSERLVAVWVGNNDNQPMSYVASGVTGASSIWNNIMVTLLDDTKPHAFAVPPGLVQLGSCISGENNRCHGCSSEKTEYYIAGTEPKSPCNVAQNSTLPSFLQRNNRNRRSTPAIEQVP